MPNYVLLNTPKKKTFKKKKKSVTKGYPLFDPFVRCSSV